MSVKQRTVKLQNLNSVDTFTQETGAVSEYFNVTDFPDELSTGRSSFLILGSQYLRQDVSIKIEILDNQGNPVYIEPVYSYEEGNGVRVSVEIYQDISAGAATLTILGEVDPTTVDYDIPPEFIDVYNVKYTKSFIINKDIPNTRPIRFFKRPQISAKEVFKPKLNIVETTQGNLTQTVGLVVGKPVANTEGRNFSLDDASYGEVPNYTDQTYGSSPIGNQSPNLGERYTFTIVGAQFSSSMQGGTLKITDPQATPYFTTQSFHSTVAYSSSIVEVLNKNTVAVQKPFGIFNSSSGDFEISAMGESLYEINYPRERTFFTSSVDFKSFAEITVHTMRTFSGDVNRVAAYVKNNGPYGNWTKIADTPIESPELLVDHNSTTSTNRLGFFKSDSIVTSFYDATSGLNGIASSTTLQTASDPEYMANSLFISGSGVDMLADDEDQAIKIQLKPQYSSSFVAGNEYVVRAKLIADNTYGEQDTIKAVFHMSGSAFNMSSVNGQYGYGEPIGRVKFDNASRQLLGQTEPEFEATFSPQRTGTGILQIRFTGGHWHVADLSIRPASETNFSPEIIKLVAPIPTLAQRPDNLDFAVEFYDVNNNKAQTVVTTQPNFPDGITFQGENLLIAGNDNTVEGSLFLGGDTTGSGIQMGGVASTLPETGGSGATGSGFIRSVQYQGFTSASLSADNTGWMIYSGSVLPDSGDNYAGVGLELVGQSGSLRFSTIPSRFEVVADAFFVGSTNTQFISGSQGIIEISSSAFHLSSSGDVIISGSITATEGSIAGWNIVGDKLSGSNATLDAGGAALYKSDEGPETNPYNGYYIDFTPTQANPYYVRFGPDFAVSSSGRLIASGAVIEGTLTASTGFIGNWVIGSNQLFKETSGKFTGMSVAGDTRFFAGATALAGSGSAPFNVKATGDITGSSVLFTGGKIGGFELTNSILRNTDNTVELSSILPGLKIKDGAGVSRVEVKSGSLSTVGGGSQYVENNSFEDQVGSLSAGRNFVSTITSWSFVEVGGVNISLTDRNGYVNEHKAVSGRVTLDVVVPSGASNYTTTNTYELTQIVTQSISAGDTLSFSSVARFSSSFSGKGKDRGLGPQYFRAEYSASGGGGWIPFLPAAEYTASNGYGEYFLGSGQYNSFGASAEVPVAAEYIRLVLTGSINDDSGFSVEKPLFAADKGTVNSDISGRTFTKQIVTSTSPEYPETEITFDNFSLRSNTRKVEMTQEGLLIYNSEDSFLKMTGAGIEFRGGSGLLSAGTSINRESFTNDSQIAGTLAAPSLQPYAANPEPIGGALSPGNVADYARGNHVHTIPSSAITNVITGSLIPSASITSLSVTHFTGSNVSSSGTGSFGQLLIAGQPVATGRWAGGSNIYYNGGNVGIGTDSPGSLLTLEGSSNPTQRIQNTTNNTYLDFRAEASTVLIRSTGAHSMRFDVNQTERMRIDTDGDVGIGSTNPQQKLDVVGNIAVTGTVDGRDLSTDGSKLDGIEASAKDDQTITAGTGLTGGGTGDVTLNVIGGTGITANANNITTTDSEIVHDNLSGFVANEHIDHSGVTITAGAGLTGGGTIQATRTLNIGQGTGIAVSADSIATNDSEIVHDNLSGFVANEHIDHSGVSITAGAGLTGGGDITATRTLNIGAGTGVTVNANDIAIGQAIGTGNSPTFAGLAITNNITVGGTVDGRDVASDGSKLDGIESGATADQSNAEIRTAVEAASDSNVFTDADHSKLNAIEASADVTDATNVQAAGAVMDSEVTDLDGIKSLTVPNNTTISTFGASLIDDAAASNARTTLGLGSLATLSSIDISSNTNLVAGTNITLSGDTLNVDDAFLKNNANDTTSGTITAAGLITSGNVSGSATSTGSFGRLEADGDIQGGNLFVTGSGQSVVQVGNTGNYLNKWEWLRDNERKWVIYNDGRTNGFAGQDSLVFKHGITSDGDDHINFYMKPDDQNVYFEGNVTGSSTSTGSFGRLDAHKIVADGSGTPLEIHGTSGSLFSVTDNFSGSLMSVSDISGIPILEVFEDDRVVMGKYSSPAMTVTGSNVGIGEISPDTKLHVTGDSGITIEESGGTTRKLILEPPDSSTSAIIRANGSSNGILLKAHNGGNQLFLKDDGNVGINQTSPSYKLDVSGTGRFTGALTTVDITASGNISSTATSGNNTFNSSILIAAGKNLFFDGGSNTYIKEHSADDLRVVAGGNTAFDFLSTGAGVPATAKLYLDGGGNTYITEGSSDVIDVYTGGTIGLKVNASEIQVQRYITHAGDTNTYIDFETDTIGFVTAGSDRLKITSDGTIGIGTTAPGVAKLNVFSSTAGGPFLYVGDGTPNNDGSWDANIMLDSNQHSRLRIENRGDNKNIQMFSHTGYNPAIFATDSATGIRMGVGGTTSLTIGTSPYLTVHGNTTISGNITVTGTVDGRDLATDGSKLDGIEANAKNDQTITAGSGLTGGGTGDVTLNIGAGTGIDVAADAISVDVSDFLSNGVDNRVVTATGTDGFAAEDGLTFDGNDLGITRKIFHIGDTDTFINFTTDDINIQAGGVNFIDITEDTTNEITINEEGVDINVRMEGDSDTHLFFLDAGNDRIGIGTATPGQKLHVVGNASIESGGIKILTNGQLLEFGDSNVHIDRAGNSMNLHAYAGHIFSINGSTAMTIDNSGNFVMGSGYIQTSQVNASSKLTGHSGGLEVQSSQTDYGGIYVSDTNGDFVLQLYGSSHARYGFLASEWGSWDFRKEIGGVIYTNNQTTYYLQPESTSHFNIITSAGNVTVGGDLIVNGTTTTVATTNMVVSDNMIELNNGASSNANDSGIIIERGSTGDNAIFVWDESADGFIVGTTTATGASTGNLTISAAPLQTAALTSTTGTFSGAISATTLNTGQGANELYAMNQDVETTDTVTFNEVHINDTNTQLEQGSGNALRIRTNSGYLDIGPMNGTYTHLYTNTTGTFFDKHIHLAASQGVKFGGHGSYTTEIYSDGATIGGGLTATTLNTGQGANELYAMNQNVRTTDDVTFDAAAFTGLVSITDTASNSTGILTITGNNAPSIKFNTPQDDWLIGTHYAGSGHDFSIINTTLSKKPLIIVNDTVGIGGNGSSNGTDPTGLGLIIDGSTAAFSTDVTIADGESIGTTTYSSGFAGSGFRIDQGITEAGKTSAAIDNLTVRGTMSIYELQIQQVRATNGNLFISSTGKADTVVHNGGVSYTVFPDSGSSSGHGFAAGDIIRMQRFDNTGTGGSVTVSDLHVQSVAGTGSFTANLVGSTTAPAKGFEYVRLGSSTNADRRGGIYLTADDDNAPFIDVFDNITSHADFNANTGSATTNASSPGTKVRIGKLTGITSANFGAIGSNVYGLWASGSVYLEGAINATSGLIGGWNINDATLTGGSITLDKNGIIRSATNFSSGNGFYLDASTFRVGTAAGSRFQWDNTNVEIYNSSNVKLVSLGATNTIAGWEVTQGTFQYNNAAGSIALDATNQQVSIHTGSINTNRPKVVMGKLPRVGGSAADDRYGFGVFTSTVDADITNDDSYNVLITRDKAKLAGWDLIPGNIQSNNTFGSVRLSSTKQALTIWTGSINEAQPKLVLGKLPLNDGTVDSPYGFAVFSGTGTVSGSEASASVLITANKARLAGWELIPGRLSSGTVADINGNQASIALGTGATTATGTPTDGLFFVSASANPVFYVGSTFSYVNNELKAAGWTLNAASFTSPGNTITIHSTSKYIAIGTGGYKGADTIYLDGANSRMSVGPNFYYESSTLTVAGWTINSDTITSTNTILGLGYISLGSGTSAYNSANRIYIDGNNTRMSLGTGFRYTSNALTIDGNATIAGWTISSNNINKNNVKLSAVSNAEGLYVKKTSYSSTTAGGFLGLDGGVAKFNVGNASKFIKFNGTHFTVDAGNFSLDASGNMTATSATLSGTVTAGAGNIGGFGIGANSVTSSNNNFALSSTQASMSLGVNKLKLAGGTDSYIAGGGHFSSPFQAFNNDVTGFVLGMEGSDVKFELNDADNGVGMLFDSSDGTLSVQGAITANTITANSAGTIAGWTVNSGSLTKNNVSLQQDSTYQLTGSSGTIGSKTLHTNVIASGLVIRNGETPILSVVSSSQGQTPITALTGSAGTTAPDSQWVNNSFEDGDVSTWTVSNSSWTNWAYFTGYSSVGSTQAYVSASQTYSAGSTALLTSTIEKKFDVSLGTRISIGAKVLAEPSSNPLYSRALGDITYVNQSLVVEIHTSNSTVAQNGSYTLHKTTTFQNTTAVQKYVQSLYFFSGTQSIKLKFIAKAQATKAPKSSVELGAWAIGSVSVNPINASRGAGAKPTRTKPLVELSQDGLLVFSDEENFLRVNEDDGFTLKGALQANDLTVEGSTVLSGSVVSTAELLISGSIKFTDGVFLGVGWDSPESRIHIIEAIDNDISKFQTGITPTQYGSNKSIAGVKSVMLPYTGATSYDYLQAAFLAPFVASPYRVVNCGFYSEAYHGVPTNSDLGYTLQGPHTTLGYQATGSVALNKVQGFAGSKRMWGLDILQITGGDAAGADKGDQDELQWAGVEIRHDLGDFRADDGGITNESDGSSAHKMRGFYYECSGSYQALPTIGTTSSHLLDSARDGGYTRMVGIGARNMRSGTYGQKAGWGLFISGSEWPSCITGQLGIGDAPNTGIDNDSKLHIVKNSSASDGIVNITSLDTTSGTYHSMFTLKSYDSSRYNYNYYIKFMGNSQTTPGTVGSINSEVVYSTFTGAHVSQRPSGSTSSGWRQGSIVKSTGNIISSGSGIGLAWPEVDIATAQKDKTVIGVYDITGPAGHDYVGLDNTREMLSYNAVGEGKMLVTDSNGTIENGDYICSSNRAGHGEKQDEVYLANFTVAKATETIDFSNVEVDSELGFKSTLICCTYHCG